MDSIINLALEEISSRGAAGITFSALTAAISSSSTSASASASYSNSAIWNRLLSIPVLQFVDASNCSLSPNNPKIQSWDELEKFGLRIVADEQLRDCFAGLDDLNAANGKISDEQRRTLERIAAARMNGITQWELSKEFGIKGNNFFYQVRNLESQQLIVRQSTTVWEKGATDKVDNEPKTTQILHTNMLHLYRYAKTANLNSQQKFEITKRAGPDMIKAADNADKSSLTGDVSTREGVKEDTFVKDYLPDMKAVCDKLEEANEKVLVVSDIKLALGYRKSRGHRTWRNVLSRLEDAGLVETIQAEINNKDVKCVRLLKKFDPRDFRSKSTVSGYDVLDSDNLVKHGKRGQITDQFLELPLEHCIYDMVDAEGPKGITILEVCKRLGLSSKKMYNRIVGMCARFRMCMESEKPNKTQLYRVWTHKNYLHYSTNVSSGNCEEVPVKNRTSMNTSDIVLYDQSASEAQPINSSIEGEDLHSMKTHSAQIGLQPPQICNGPLDPVDEISSVDNDAMLVTVESNVISSERPLTVSPTTSKKTHWYRTVSATVLGARRERSILKKLEDDKFILYGELYRWLNNLEKDKPTMLCRKTLFRTLNKLQNDGLCKITQVTIPAMSNFNKSLEQAVILHPSVANISSDILNQLYKRYKDFEFQSHSREYVKSNNPPVTVLTGVKRSINPLDDKPLFLEAMRANGYVHAKLIRAKLLHKFLWGYVSGLPDWRNTLHSTTNDKICQFSMTSAVDAMLLELFLQIVGSSREIDNIVHRCKLRLRLMDLSIQEYKQLLNTHAIARLSRLINTLLLMKLIKLVREGPESMELLPHATPTHAMELEPYIEEPLPRVLPPLKINSSDLRPRRHDFVLSDIEDVNAYWETLEYCYAAADPTSASLAFPGSVIREVSSARSWASVRVMSAEQREELLKQMEFGDLEKKMPFKKCVVIARELNLSVDQVLRVSYDKQRRAQNNSKFKEEESCINANINGSVLRKRKRTTSRVRSVQHIQDDAEIGTAHSTGENDTEFHDNPLEACRVNCEENSAVERESDGEDDPSFSLISCSAISKPKPTRRKMYSWSDKSDRQLIMQYARYRAIMGPNLQRVNWTSLSDLPTLPEICKRRMSILKSDTSTWRAVLGLCNLLEERFLKYLKNARKMLETEGLSCDDSVRSLAIIDETDDQSLSACHKDSYENWDNFEDPNLKMAVDEVLICNKMAKLEYAKRHSLRHGKCLHDTPDDATNLDIQERVYSNTVDRNDSLGETGNTAGNIVRTTGKSKSKSHQLHKKFSKLLDSRGIGIGRQVCKSITVANAVELLKLVFLSNFSAAEVQASLAATLQLYSKCDLLAAFNFLKEREFVVIRSGSQSAVLSQKFWHNASSSPFPIDSGKRATSFLSWLHRKDNCMEDGLDLSIDIQCGEVFHLFALVSSEEVLISPCLPEDGIGEADESKSSLGDESKSSQSPMNVDVEKRNLKRKSDALENPSSSEKGKSQKTQGKFDGDFCNRREKGFPGIKVFLNCATIPTYEKMNSGKYLDKEAISFASSSSNFRSSDNVCGKNQLNAPLSESQWDNMSKYAALLLSRFVVRNEVITFSPEAFKSVYSAIDQAGEQGLSFEDISVTMGVQGVQFAKVVVDTLENFKLAIKVNAYDCIRVVASSYRSMYFIRVLAGHNQSNFMASNMKSYNMNYKKDHQLSRPEHDSVCISQNDSMNVSDTHKVTLLDFPAKSSVPQGEIKMNEESSISDKSTEGDAVSLDETDVYCSILPWINGDGNTNTIVYKGLTRRVLGIVMQNPGILEDNIICKMDVLNPQSCRRLLETMILDDHIIVRKMPQTTTVAPPSLLQNLFSSDITEKSEFRKHYFANPMSTSLL